MNKRTKYIIGALAATAAIAGTVAIKKKSTAKKDMGVSEMKELLNSGDETSFRITKNVSIKALNDSFRPNILYVENEKESNLMKAWENNKDMNAVFVTDNLDTSEIRHLHDTYNNVEFINCDEPELLIYQRIDRYVNSLFVEDTTNALVIEVSDEKMAGDVLSKLYNTILDFSDINNRNVEFTEIFIDKQGVYQHTESFLSLIDLAKKYNVGTILKIEGKSYDEFSLLQSYFDLLVCNGNRDALQNLIIEFSIPDKYDHLLFENGNGRSYVLYKDYYSEGKYKYACLDKSL